MRDLRPGIKKHQDLCRFHRTDLWGKLKRDRRISRLARKLYKRQHGYTFKTYEVIQFNLKKVRFVKKKKFRKKQKLLFDRLRLNKIQHYFCYPDKKLLLFSFFNRPWFRRNYYTNSFKRNLLKMSTRMFVLRIDSIVLALGWATSIIHAKNLIRRGVFLLNYQIIKNEHFILSSNDRLSIRKEFRVHVKKNFERLRYNRLKNLFKIFRMKNRLFNEFIRNKKLWKIKQGAARNYRFSQVYNIRNSKRRLAFKFLKKMKRRIKYRYLRKNRKSTVGNCTNFIYSTKIQKLNKNYKNIIRYIYEIFVTPRKKTCNPSPMRVDSTCGINNNFESKLVGGTSNINQISNFVSRNNNLKKLFFLKNLNQNKFPIKRSLIKLLVIDGKYIRDKTYENKITRFRRSNKNHLAIGLRKKRNGRKYKFISDEKQHRLTMDKELLDNINTKKKLDINRKIIYSDLEQQLVVAKKDMNKKIHRGKKNFGLNNKIYFEIKEAPTIENTIYILKNQLIKLFRTKFKKLIFNSVNKGATNKKKLENTILLYFSKFSFFGEGSYRLYKYKRSLYKFKLPQTIIKAKKRLFFTDYYEKTKMIKLPYQRLFRKTNLLRKSPNFYISYKLSYVHVIGDNFYNKKKKKFLYYLPFFYNNTLIFFDYMKVIAHNKRQFNRENRMYDRNSFFFRYKKKIHNKYFRKDVVKEN